jgi:hypothetical protein
MPLCWWRLDGSAITRPIVARCSGCRSAMLPVERMERRQPVVARADAVAPVCLEVVEEGTDQRRVKLVDVELAGPLAGLLGGASSSRNVSRYEAIVCGLTSRWVIRCSVKNCKVGAIAVMRAPPAGARAGC